MQYQFYYDQYRQWQLYLDYLMDDRYIGRQFPKYIIDHCTNIKSASYGIINDQKHGLTLEFDTEIDYDFFILSL